MEKATKTGPPWMCCIVTRVVPSGKKNFVAPQLVMEYERAYCAFWPIIASIYFLSWDPLFFSTWRQEE
jgi:hypothetical protein